MEDLNDKLDALLEGQIPLAPMSRKIDGIDERLIRVESDVKIMKRVLTEHSNYIRRHDRRLDNHDKRITTLEQPA